MSIPIDRLYHYIEKIAVKTHNGVLIYRFFPHGSKKLEDLNPLTEIDWVNCMISPQVICHDQEPLDFDFYQNYLNLNDNFLKLYLKYNCYKPYNLRFPNILDKSVLIHSEKRSTEIEKYIKNNLIPVYYWSHAVIALDWFRFAQHVEQQKKANKCFLMYNRAWIGSREYRLKFLELLVQNNLVKDCKTTINPNENGIYYNNHKFKNPIWRPNIQLENFFPKSTVESWASADFVLEDYESTNIEVVLETLFDDQRLHLTEKILRPIACGQPFILASTYQSLKYLKEYGFKTFDNLWSEDYDEEKNPERRLEMIVNLMKTISSWDHETIDQKMKQAKIITDFNKKHFFSKEFLNFVLDELEKNLNLGLKELVATNTSKEWLDRVKEICQYEEINNVFFGKLPFLREHKDPKYPIPASLNTSEVLKVVSIAEQNYKKSIRDQ